MCENFLLERDKAVVFILDGSVLSVSQVCGVNLMIEPIQNLVLHLSEDFEIWV